MPLTIDDTFGFLPVEIRSQDGTVASVMLDVWECWSAYNQLFQKHGDTPALGDAWSEFLASKGLPDLSHGAAYRISDALKAEVETAKKNGPG